MCLLRFGNGVVVCSFADSEQLLRRYQVEDLTEYRDILNKYTVTLLLKNVVFSNIEI